MNTKNLYLAPECLGNKFLLVDVTPNYYSGSTRMAEPVGFRYAVCVPALSMEKLCVKIAGQQLMDAPAFEQPVYVAFEGLRVHPYVNINGRMALTASATGIRAINGKD